jgi:hypothetical protein
MKLQGSRRKRGTAQHQAIVLAAQQAALMRSENRGRRPTRIGKQNDRIGWLCLKRHPLPDSAAVRQLDALRAGQKHERQELADRALLIRVDTAVLASTPVMSICRAMMFRGVRR